MAGVGVRPVGVTLVVVIMVITGIVGLIANVIGLFRPNDGNSIIVSIVGIVFSLIYLAVAKGIANGNNFSRFLVGLVTFISLLGGIWAILPFTNGTFWYGLWQIVISLIILGILYSAKARVFFD